MINIKFDGISWIETNIKINGRQITKETIEKLHIWIYNNARVVNSPLKNGHVSIKDDKTNEVI